MANGKRDPIREQVLADIALLHPRSITLPQAKSIVQSCRWSYAPQRGFTGETLRTNDKRIVQAAETLGINLQFAEETMFTLGEECNFIFVNDAIRTLAQAGADFPQKAQILEGRGK